MQNSAQASFLERTLENIVIIIPESRALKSATYTDYIIQQLASRVSAPQNLWRSGSIFDLLGMVNDAEMEERFSQRIVRLLRKKVILR